MVIEKMNSRILNRDFIRKFAIIWVTALVFVGLSATTHNFLTVTNLRNILDQQAFILIVAAFTTLVLISGGFDVSLGAIYVMGPIVAMRVEHATHSTGLMLLAASAVGLICGVFNGLVVAFGKINSFIATLASSFIFFGLGYVFSGQGILTISNFSERKLVTHRIFGITSATWMAVLAIAIAWILLDRTKYGRFVFAIGGNIEAARLAGIRVRQIQIITFALAGFGASFAGTLAAIRATSVQASDDLSVIFAVVAAIIVGGTSIAGGAGSIWRTVIGVFFIAFIVNGFNLNGIDPVFQRVIEGVVILLAVGADAFGGSPSD